MTALIQTDAELREILTWAFILRSVELIAAGVGDIVLVGSTHSASTSHQRVLEARSKVLFNGFTSCLSRVIC